MDRPRTYDDISPPSRPLSRLEAHHFAAVAKSRGPWEREYDSLITEFAWWNEMKRTKADFPLSKLLSSSPNTDKPWGEFASWPGSDHTVYFRRGRQPAAVLTEPYGTYDVERLKIYAFDRGLSVHLPRNPFASFWFPGWTYCVLITGPDFGRVLWLEDQLMFETQGLVT